MTVALALDSQTGTLCRAEERDIDQLMKWFPDQESVAIWGGPGFRYPFTRHSFAEDIGWRRTASFSLRNAFGDLAAFGQLYERDARIHLARLATAPSLRGRGVGKQLIAELMHQGMSMFSCREYSLFVFRDNLPAQRCYRSMGFELAKYPEGMPHADVCDFLTRPVATEEN